VHSPPALSSRQSTPVDKAASSPALPIDSARLCLHVSTESAENPGYSKKYFGYQLAILPVIPTTPNPIVAEREDAEIVAAVVALQSSANFAPYRHWHRCYDRPPLKKIRLYQSMTVNHNMVAMTSETHPNRRVRKMCALCSSTKEQRSSSIQCATCKVPLCSTTLKGTPTTGATCFYKWHTCVDLERGRRRGVNQH
jgi:hypothetical protein